MHPKTTLLYWDTSVILAALDSKDTNHKDIAQLLEEISNASDKRIVTSVISKIEVAYFQSEKDVALDSNIEKIIDDFWNDETLISVIELSDEIALQSRNLVRYGVTKSGRKIKPADAIHLATARSIQAKCLYTYDDGLLKHTDDSKMRIERPHLLSPRLLS